MIATTKIFVTCAVLFASLMAHTASAAESTPPNVVLIISDDHGFPDYGFMQNKIADMPNLDRMASESMLYTRGYVMPVCSPFLACSSHRSNKDVF